MMGFQTLQQLLLLQPLCKLQPSCVLCWLDLYPDCLGLCRLQQPLPAVCGLPHCLQQAAVVVAAAAAVGAGMVVLLQAGCCQQTQHCCWGWCPQLLALLLLLLVLVLLLQLHLLQSLNSLALHRALTACLCCFACSPAPA
jgi:hypothetical protein